MKALRLALLIPLITLAGCPQPGGSGTTGSGTSSRTTGSGTVKTPSLSCRVLVVRHAQAYSNLKDTSEVPLEKLDTLTDEGKNQARAAAAIIKSETVAAILSSPRGRTQETAAIIKEVSGFKSEVEVNNAFAPIADGQLPDGSPTPWSWRKEQWKAGKDLRPTKGESLGDGADRALKKLEALAKTKPTGAIVIVTHSDIAAALLGHAANTPAWERYAKHKPPTGSVTELTYDGAAWTLIGRK